MRIVPIGQIVVGPRQRSEINQTALRELRNSILDSVLIHAPIVYQDGDKLVLIGGERRFRAIEWIARDNLTFIHDGVIIPAGMIPVTEFLGSEEERQQTIEYDENIVRVELPWQDRVRALANLHRLRQEQNPKQTAGDTAKELAAKTNTSIDHNRESIVRASIIEKHLTDPDIAKARTATEAFALITKKGEEAVIAERVRRKAIKQKDQGPSIVLRNEDSNLLLPKLPAHLVDLIIADPPYGISAGQKGFRERTVLHHNYEDSPEAAIQAINLLLSEGFRLTKPRANIFIFCDVRNFSLISDTSKRMGWEPFPTPIIWHKSNEGPSPWHGHGFRRTYEAIFYATKGKRRLLSAPVDVIDLPRVAKSERIYAAQKPVELLSLLISYSALPGDYVLDPYMGSGSTLRAARLAGLAGMGIELDPEVYKTAQTFVFSDTIDPEAEDIPE